jgi:hypothetical protein
MNTKRVFVRIYIQYTYYRTGKILKTNEFKT